MTHAQNFCIFFKSLGLTLLIKMAIIKKGFTELVFELLAAKVKIKGVFLAGHTFALVDYCVKKMIKTYSATIG